jgi:hypothetical protein
MRACLQRLAISCPKRQALKATAMLCALLAGSWTIAQSDEVDFDPVELQRAFSRVHDLKLVSEVARIPPDGKKILASIVSLSDPSVPALADIGMEWSFTDAVRTDMPWGQHRFSVFNGEMLAIVFVSGGADIRYRMILAPRRGNGYCMFRLGSLSEPSLRISFIQWLVNPDKGGIGPETPKCESHRM